MSVLFCQGSRHSLLNNKTAFSSVTFLNNWHLQCIFLICVRTLVIAVIPFFYNFDLISVRNQVNFFLSFTWHPIPFFFFFFRARSVFFTFNRYLSHSSSGWLLNFRCPPQRKNALWRHLHTCMFTFILCVLYSDHQYCLVYTILCRQHCLKIIILPYNKQLSVQEHEKGSFSVFFFFFFAFVNKCGRKLQAKSFLFI